jgi:DNA-binding NarL/FixJ family response regulator
MEGMGNKQIAGALALTEGSVKVYMARIFRKMGVHSRLQAVVKLIKEGQYGERTQEGTADAVAEGLR